MSPAPPRPPVQAVVYDESEASSTRRPFPILLQDSEGNPINPSAMQGEAGPAGPEGPEGPEGPPGQDGQDAVAINPISGMWLPLYKYHIPLISANLGAGDLKVTRTVLHEAITHIASTVTGGASGAKYRLVVYEDTANGPGALVWQSADLSAVNSADYETACALPAGAYWIGVQNVGSATFQIKSDANGINPLLPGITPLPTGTNFPANGWWKAGQGAAVPNPFPLAGVGADRAAALFVKTA